MWFPIRNKKRRGLTKSERRRKKKEQSKNRKLVKKYYWLAPRNVWTDKVPDDYDYTYIEWGWSDGWDKAFGHLYMEELGKAIKKSGQKNFEILQIKEKYGQARLYSSGTTEKVHNIIDKYEFISQNICYYCGRPDTHVTNFGWILPVCKECYEKKLRRGSKYEYEEIVCDEDPMIPSIRKVTQFSKDGEQTIEYDISETVGKIRKWWNKKHPNKSIN